MDLKIILFVLILVIIPISNAYPTVDYVIGEENKSTPTPTLTLNPTSTIPSTNTESNVVIVIDASGSTGKGSPSPISLIQANAIYAIQNVSSDTFIAVVAFGGSTVHTDLIPINNEANNIL